MIKNYFKIAWRNLIRNKSYSLINVLGLALGMVCVLFILLWAKDELSFDRFHQKSARIYRVIAEVQWNTNQIWTTTPARLAGVLREEIPEIQKVTKTTGERDLLVKVDEEGGKERGMYAGPDFLTMFTFPLIKGNAKTALDGPNDIVVSQRFSERYFHGNDPIGKMVRIGNNQDYQVTGVMKNVPSNSSQQFDFLLPQASYEKGKDWVQRWGVFSFNTYVQLSTGVDKTIVDKKIANIIEKQSSEESGYRLFLEPITDIHLYNNYSNGKPEGGRIVYIYLFSVIALFILLIACINFMNAATARSVRRAKEVGVRKTSGAGRFDLASQFIGEALITAGISMMIALFFFELFLPFFNHLTGKNNLDLSFWHPFMPFMLLGITLVTGVLAGSYPAFFLSSFKPVNTLKGDLRLGPANTRLRKILVVFQFTISIALMVATVVVYQQIQYIRQKNLGFDKENLIISPLTGDLYNNRERFKEELQKSSSIRSATFVSDNPLDIQGSSGDLSWPGKAPDKTVDVTPLSVGYDFLQTMKIPIKEGRDFSPNRASDSTAYVINESAARLMGMKDPLGKEIEFWLGKGPIIGIVRDFHFASMHEKIRPLIMMAMPDNAEAMLIRTAPGQTQQAIIKFQQVAKQLNPAYPFEYHFLDELYKQQYKSELMIETLARASAFLVIFITCLGLFGLVMFMIEQRTKEIGIRKVLGATTGNIVKLFSSYFIKPVLLGYLIAVPVSWYCMSRWLHGYAYHTTMGISPYVIAGAAALFIALVTVSWQCIRAALANPVESLRSE